MKKIYYSTALILFYIGAFGVLMQGCSGSRVMFLSGDEELSFIDGNKPWKVRFDRSNLTIGKVKHHSFDEETFLKTRQKGWREKWVSHWDSVYAPAFDSMLVEVLDNNDFPIEIGTHVKQTDRIITIDVEHIYMGDLHEYKTGNSEGLGSSYPRVEVDFRILFQTPSEKEGPLTTLSYPDVRGKPFEVSLSLPVSSFIESAYEKLGRELGEYIVNQSNV